ncbi:MAG TPA: alpha/beta hydrolase-fold protein [Thermoleophilia bacterium]|nr:alpha/beta hydrolase-fold protein [Thermoleophilia bacterium]
MRHTLEAWPPQAGMTRRQFLAGAGVTAGAVLVGGGLAARILPWRDWYSTVRGDVGNAGLLHGLSGASVRSYSLDSLYVKDPVEYVIAWPPVVKPGDPLPVCFALPGRGGGPPMGFADVVATLAGDGKISPYAVVGVAGGVSYWHARATGEDRLSMLLREIVPLCATRHQLGGSGGRRAVIGWSMGGYGALLAAETRPRMFAAVVAVSPAVWTSYEAMMLGPRDAFDDAADFARHDVIAHADRLAGTDLRIDIGTGDPFCGYVTHLEAALPRRPAGGYLPGGHDPAYWSKVAPAEARFIGRALG